MRPRSFGRRGLFPVTVASVVTGLASMEAGCDGLLGIHQLSATDASLADAHASETSTRSDATRDAAEGGDAAPACSPSLDGGTPPATGSCTAAGFCWLSPGLPASELTAVSGVCGDVWAVGYGGTVLHRGRDAWASVTPPTTVNLEAVVRVGTNDVWAGDDDGSLYHYDGSKWTSYANSVADASIYTLWGAASDDVWAAGTNGSQGVLMHWNGAAWTHDALEQTTVQLVALSGTSSDDVWVAGDKLYHWTGSWSAVSGMPAACSFTSVFADAPGSAWTVCATDVSTLFHGSALTGAASMRGAGRWGLATPPPGLSGARGAPTCGCSASFPTLRSKRSSVTTMATRGPSPRRSLVSSIRR